MYSEGLGVRPNHEEAFQWALKAAKQNYAQGQHNVAVYYYEWGDYSQALYGYHKAAEQGNAASQFNLALIYTKGKGTPVNHQEAFKWNLKATEQDQPQSQVNLATQYQNGEGVEQNFHQAIGWYVKAAQKIRMGRIKLAVMHELGQSDTPQDKAILERYANSNNPRVQSIVGNAYYFGREVPQSYEKALPWLIKAAENDLSNAQRTLEFMYYYGQVTEPDYVKAHQFFLQAARQGDPHCTSQRGAYVLLW